MGYLKYLKKIWTENSKNRKDLVKTRLVAWRNEPATIRIEHPTRLDSARSVGYKAKEGYIVVRQRLPRGQRQREQIRAGRKTKQMRRRKVLEMSYQWVAEQRAAKKYPNCEVLNSYYVAKDGLHYWYEVILVDKSNPHILHDKKINWISQPQHTGRVFRGLTSAGRKSRGLLNKGKGAEKIRPSIRANKRLK